MTPTMKKKWLFLRIMKKKWLFLRHGVDFTVSSSSAPRGGHNDKKNMIMGVPYPPIKLAPVHFCLYLTPPKISTDLTPHEG